MATMEPEYDLDAAEGMKLPSTGRHRAALLRAELTRNKKDTHDMIVGYLGLAQDDPDAPGFPVRLYLMLPNVEEQKMEDGRVIPSDKDVIWKNGKSAFGSYMDDLKKTMTAIGGQESGSISQSKVMTALIAAEGKMVKVNLTHSLRDMTDEEKADPELRAKAMTDPNRINVNCDGIEPA